MTVLSVLYQTMPARQLKKDTETISSMFDSIAPTYDRLNHILSFGIDRSWRRRLVRKVVGSVQGNGSVKVLDVACGTMCQWRSKGRVWMSPGLISPRKCWI